jgi:signal transduction histidine kinase
MMEAYMKLKTRLITSFLIVIFIPIFLSVALVFAVGKYQIRSIEQTYGITGMTVESFSNSIPVLTRLTEEPYQELKKMASDTPENMEDATCLEAFNQELTQNSSYLLVRKNSTIIYMGEDADVAEKVIPSLPPYEGVGRNSESGMYLGGDIQVLVKQVDFEYTDGDQGSAYIVTDVKSVIPEVKQFFVDIVLCVVFVLIVTATILSFWIYHGIMKPVENMRIAAKNIKDGNLDFELKAESDDELGSLCQDLEEMRIRLKNNAEDKIKFDQENKELISNISHDLKTPVTTIKGYAEGIIDGVADTPEKMEKYVRTIYNKANEMNTLINELTLYSRIDTNRIPYNFNTILVNAYFDDCADDLSLELEAKNVDFGYYNYVESDVKVIADPEQIGRVIHNIINNSLKYMDKPKGKINLRVKDVGDFVQVELEDNGKGIAAKDLPNIFDRFYRTDASRNSSKGGSGIGLSIVKKIVEEHGGKIWATSKLETGTTMYFVLRKYQEVPIHE